MKEQKKYYENFKQSKDKTKNEHGTRMKRIKNELDIVVHAARIHNQLALIFC